MWTMMSVGDVAVMTSPRANVNWCRSGAWRRVKNVVSTWRRVKNVVGAWRRVKKFVSVWKYVESVRR